MLPNIKNKKIDRVYQNKGKMRYGSRTYSNPFFDDRKKLRKSSRVSLSIKIKIFISLAFLLVVGIFWFLMYSSFFKIKSIDVSGGGKIPPSEIEKVLWEEADSRLLIFFPRRNIFLFKKSRVEERLDEKYSFNELKINKKFPNKIYVTYNEKKYAYLWKEDDKIYYTDVGGEIISETTLEEAIGKDYPIIENLSNSKINNRQIGISSSFTDFIIEAYSNFKKYHDDFMIDKAIIDNDINTVKIQLKDGPSVYFNIERGVEEQIDKLLIVKNEKIKEDFAAKSYIDLRVGNSVYYR